MGIDRDAESLRGGKILPDGAKLVQAINESEMEHISATESGAYTWYSSFATGATNIEVLTIQNDHTTKDLIIEKIFLAAAGAAVLTVGDVTTGTPAGTTVTPGNLNRDSIKSGTVISTSFGNASVTGTVVLTNRWGIPVLAGAPPFVIDTQGAWLLGNGDILGISCSTNTTVYVTVEGYFADPSQL